MATARSQARIDLTWVDTTSAEAGYYIERSDDVLPRVWVRIAQTVRSTTAYSDFEVIPGTTYHYQVAAFEGGFVTDFAGPATAATKTQKWTSIAGGPGTRSEHSAVFDPLGHRMIVFGGMDLNLGPVNEVWILSLPAGGAPSWAGAPATTTLAPPLVAIPELGGHSAIFDDLNNRMLVFGGQLLMAGGESSDVYILDFKTIPPTWSLAAVSGTPPTGREGHTAIYDKAGQRMVIHGGYDGAVLQNGVFTLSLPASGPLAWSAVSAGVPPKKRSEHGSIYDPLRDQLLSFGGQDQDLQGDGSLLNNETWTLRLGANPSWNPLSFTGTPSLRMGHSSVYDSVNQRMLVFGGNTDLDVNAVTSELWALKLDGTPTWTLTGAASGPVPGPRFGHTAVYDSTNEVMVINGGADSGFFPFYSDTLVFSVGP